MPLNAHAGEDDDLSRRRHPQRIPTGKRRNRALEAQDRSHCDALRSFRPVDAPRSTADARTITRRNLTESKVNTPLTGSSLTASFFHPTPLKSFVSPRRGSLLLSSLTAVYQPGKCPHKCPCGQAMFVIQWHRGAGRPGRKRHSLRPMPPGTYSRAYCFVLLVRAQASAPRPREDGEHACFGRSRPCPSASSIGSFYLPEGTCP